MDSINNITHCSDLSSDLIWIHTNTYDFKMYYETESINFVCDHFINKWLESDPKKNENYKELFATLLHD